VAASPRTGRIEASKHNFVFAGAASITHGPTTRSFGSSQFGPRSSNSEAYEPSGNRGQPAGRADPFMNFSQQRMQKVHDFHPPLPSTPYCDTDFDAEGGLHADQSNNGFAARANIAG